VLSYIVLQLWAILLESCFEFPVLSESICEAVSCRSTIAVSVFHVCKPWSCCRDYCRIWTSYYTESSYAL